MDNLAKIAEFAEAVFDLYAINKYGFFFTQDPIEKYREIPLFDETKESTEATLKRLSCALGLTTEELRNTDKRAALRYWRQFPFFQLRNDYYARWGWSYDSLSPEPTAEEILAGAIFDVKPKIEFRYNWDEVNERFVREVIRLSEFSPELYPKGTVLHILQSSTENFFSFDKCPDLIESYISMVERLHTLFFCAKDNKLQPAEILEYNFLVSYLDVRDICRPLINLSYDEIEAIRPALQEEPYKDFQSYAVMKNCFTRTSPWRCEEFFYNRDLILRFISLFPNAKALMRKFSMNIRHFSYTYRWEKPSDYKVDGYEYLDSIDEIPYDVCGPVQNVYIEKSPDEEESDCSALDILREMIAPPSMGGLQLPEQESIPDPGTPEAKARVQRRLAGR